MYEKFTKKELNICFTLSLVMATRILGLFILLPVFSILAKTLHNSTPENIGVAIGIYGLVQSCMHLPCAILSDIFGRKTIICIATLVFLIGSLICALSNNIWWVILGRAIQGMGATGAVALAIIADNTREEIRSSAMLIVGLGITLAFFSSIILGPYLSSIGGISSIFWLIVILSLISIYLSYFKIQEDEVSKTKFSIRDAISTILGKDLRIIYITVILQHSLFAALFYVIPLILINEFNLPINKHGIYYFVIVLTSIIPIYLLMRMKKFLTLEFLTAGLLISTLTISLYGVNNLLFFIGLFFLFVFFTILEAFLPTKVSSICTSKYRGSVMGVYSSAQFLGIFVGSLTAGLMYSNYNYMNIFIFFIFSLIVLLMLQVSTNKVKINKSMKIER